MICRQCAGIGRIIFFFDEMSGFEEPAVFLPSYSLIDPNVESCDSCNGTGDVLNTLSEKKLWVLINKSESRGLKNGVLG